jgi:hypothetical protein
MNKTREQLQRMLYTLFDGITLIDHSNADTRQNHIYIVKRGSTIIRWFTSSCNENISQIISLNSFFNANINQLIKSSSLEKLPSHIERYKYKISTDARHKITGLKICSLTNLAYLGASEKSLIAIIPPGKTGIVIKTSRLKQNLLNEHQTLKHLRAKVKSPYPINYKEINENFSFTAQTLLIGKAPNQNQIQVLDELVLSELKNLTCANITTSIKNESELILDNLSTKNLTGSQKSTIERLLSPNKCRQQVEASIVHGDLRPANTKILLQQKKNPQISLRFLDWEFSQKTGIGAIDYIRWKLDTGYIKANSLEELLKISNFKKIKASLRSSTLPGSHLSIDELMRLHIAKHAVDRFHSFWRPGIENIRLNNLQRIINSEWPGDLNA